MKTYVLMISKTFMKGHPRAGQPTDFKRKLLTGALSGDAKLHTIRSGYEHWSKVCREVNNDEAVLSLREWSGKPYASRQEEIVKVRRLGLERVAVRRRTILANGLHQVMDDPKEAGIYTYIDIKVNGRGVAPGQIAHNDGLSWKDFFHWFNKDFDGVIIHFSRLRYDA